MIPTNFILFIWATLVTGISLVMFYLLFRRESRTEYLKHLKGSPPQTVQEIPTMSINLVESTGEFITHQTSIVCKGWELKDVETSFYKLFDKIPKKKTLPKK